MNPTDESLLKELNGSLDDKIQKAVLAAYVKNPSPESVVVALLRILEKATAKK